MISIWVRREGRDRDEPGVSEYSSSFAIMKPSTLSEILTLELRKFKFLRSVELISPHVHTIYIIDRVIIKTVAVPSRYLHHAYLEK